MTLSANNRFPSDCINAIWGRCGNEPRSILRWWCKNKEILPDRIVLAINQYYPELKSGFYFNKTVLAAIHLGINRAGFFVVIEDNYRKSGVVPVEPVGSLEKFDDYIIVDANLNCLGRIRIWESLGGRLEFYHDKVLFEIATTSSAAELIMPSIHHISEQNGIRFEVSRPNPTNRKPENGSEPEKGSMC